MRKLLFILLLIPIVFITCSCEDKTYDEISYSEFKEMMDNEESFVLFIGSTTCKHCDAYKVTLNKVINEYDVDIKYIDISKLDDKDYSALQAKIPFSGTPTTVFIENGEEESSFNRVEGEGSYSEVVEILEKNGYIKEDKK